MRRDLSYPSSLAPALHQVPGVARRERARFAEDPLGNFGLEDKGLRAAGAHMLPVPLVHLQIRVDRLLDLFWQRERTFPSPFTFITLWPCVHLIDESLSWPFGRIAPEPL